MWGLRVYVSTAAHVWRYAADSPQDFPGTGSARIVAQLQVGRLMKSAGTVNDLVADCCLPKPSAAPIQRGEK